MPLLPSNPYVRALLGGLVAALTVASPIVDDGVSTSEILSIMLAFLTGSGLTAAPSGRKNDRADLR